MAFKRKETTSDIVAVITLPLCCESWQLAKLDKLFWCYNNIKNALISKKLKSLSQLERNKEWRSVSEELKALCKEQHQLAKENKDLPNKKAKRLSHLKNVSKSLIKQYGFTNDDFSADIKDMRKHYKQLHSAVVQNMATDVWKTFESYFYKNGKSISFSNIDRFATISGKSNSTGIVVRDKAVLVADMKIPFKIGKDKYGYEAEALSRTIHFCKITRRWRKHGWAYFVQIVYAGTPPVKVKPNTGELLHPIGNGSVGLDIGTKTLAVCSDTHVEMDFLAENIKSESNKIKYINRAMDRSRRVSNPEMYDSEGRIIPINKLDKSLIRKNGKRDWKYSNNYKKLRSERRLLYTLQKEKRTQSHNQLANKLLAYGDTFIIEEMTYAGLAKKAKKQETAKTTAEVIQPVEKVKTVSAKSKSKAKKDIAKYKKKNGHRKRFGTSIQVCSPASFVNILESKVHNMKGIFKKVNPYETKASQYNHESKTYTKKKLSQRWNVMSDGSKIQRDLYSAFLLQNINLSDSTYDQQSLDAKYGNFKVRHDEAVNKLRCRPMLPSSVGI